MLGAPPDVMAALAYARDHHLPVAVRSGGHSVSGYGMCDDGVVHRPLADEGHPGRSAAPHRARRGRPHLGRVRSRDGRLYGLATTGGRVSRRVSRPDLGSGSGWLERKHGLTCDNLLAADV